MNDGSSVNADGHRYRVKQGIDGSWLVVDHGSDRTQRTAIHRITSEAAARQEADTLSELDHVTSTLATPSSQPWVEIDRIVTETAAAVDAQDSFNHLLKPTD